MLDWFIILAPVLLVPVLALLKFVGCDVVFGLHHLDPGTLTVTPDPVTLSAGQTQQFTATANWDNPDITWSVSSTVSMPGTITPQNGLYTAPATVLVAFSEQVIASAVDPEHNAITAAAIVNLLSGNSATFVRFDDITQGSWHGMYGADGYALAHQPQPDLSIPSAYLDEPFVTPPQIFRWEDPSVDLRALQNPFPCAPASYSGPTGATSRDRLL